MLTGNDRVSVVTVCKNAQNIIKQTILSVLEQTYPNLEFIIVDGQSSDGTKDILDIFTDKIDVYISEKDNGIYDAMNKGIRKATGNWLCFMNAGDTFVHKNVISDIFSNSADYNGKMVIYGDFVVEGSRQIVKASDISVIKHRMPFCHQSAFLRNQGFCFRTDLQIASDYALFYDIFMAYGSSAFFYTKCIIAVFDESGISVRNLKLLYKEYYKLHIEHKEYLYGFYYLFMSCCRNIKHRLFPAVKSQEQSKNNYY